VKGPFGLRINLPSVTTSLQSNYLALKLSKVEAILLSALPKNTTSELVGLSSTLSIFDAERQVTEQGSCEYQIPTFNVF